MRPKPSRIAPLEKLLFGLHATLISLPSVAPQHPLAAARTLLKTGIAVPYSLPLPTEDTSWTVAFEKPTDITLVGSWANHVSVKSKDNRPFGVDLAVEMPDVRSSVHLLHQFTYWKTGPVSRKGLSQQQIFS